MTNTVVAISVVAIVLLVVIVAVASHRFVNSIANNYSDKECDEDCGNCTCKNPPSNNDHHLFI